MKLKLLLCCTFLVSSTLLPAQHQPGCLFYSLHPNQDIFRQVENTVQQHSVGSLLLRGETKIIPVVVHIIHGGGIENISDAQVYSQMDVLNKDFRRLNADTVNTNPVFQGVAADMELEFCLASKDPLGNPTTGIDRVFQTDTTLYSWQLIQQYGWDNDQYLNIYVTKNIGCFSSFPGDPDSTDGIFITHGRFGTIGTAGSELYAEFSKFGRVGTHEVGHYIGLYHTFSSLNDCDSNCSTTGDYVCDTPPADMRWFVFECMPQITNTCMETPDQPDQVENYMDYNTDSCSNMFSEGQKTRAHICLDQYRSTLWSASNLVATGCMGSSGNEETEKQIKVNIYPNPASQSATVWIDNHSGGMYTLAIYDIQGKLVRWINNMTGETTTINRDGLVNGMYFFHIRAGNQLIHANKIIFE